MFYCHKKYNVIKLLKMISYYANKKTIRIEIFYISHINKHL
jgi:hypothetical protein